MNRKKDRILIAATKSGSGKTLFTCGLLMLLSDLHKDGAAPVKAHKCGPDYIDPMFHRTVLGIEGTNLDPFFSDKNELVDILAEGDAGITVLEGAMGIYDGISGMGKTGSCYDVACKTKTPIILIMDAKGMGNTMISLLRGVIEEDDASLIKGVVFNRMSSAHLGLIKDDLETMLHSVRPDIHILGALPEQKDLKLESRHLGLVMPDEISGIKDMLGSFAAVINENIDMKTLLQIAEGADPLPADGSLHGADGVLANADMNAFSGIDAPVLAVAKDEAFCFFYEQNLKLLEKNGIKINYFSPLHDEALPEGACGLLLCGGYPELFAKELSENIKMKTAVKEAIESGMPSLAECGGFMYLGKEIADENGIGRQMTGITVASFKNSGKLTRFGYVTVSPEKDGLLNGSVKGHEFHYYDSEENGGDCMAAKPNGKRSWPCMYMDENHLWGFPHLYYPSCPSLIERFAEQMCRYAEKRT